MKRILLDFNYYICNKYWQICITTINYLYCCEGLCVGNEDQDTNLKFRCIFTHAYPCVWAGWLGLGVGLAGRWWSLATGLIGIIITSSAIGWE